MGLLDTREPPTYSENLQKYNPVMGRFERLLNLKSTKMTTDKDIRQGFRFFHNNILFHQGVPSVIKSGIVYIGVTAIVILPYLIASKFTKYRKDPFR